MEFHQFHLESLGHASYLVGSGATGEALVLDPRRDVDVYLDAAHQRGLRIRYVIDTHQHNDYLSGIRELVERTGATALGSAEADLGYPHDPVKDGHELEIGDVGLKVIHTPGHTPEHVSIVVYDGEHSDEEPALLLSGGALLVGDLARPDLLGGDDEVTAAAERFCETIQAKILTLPDHTLVYPTHVAGSLCGGSIGSRLSTTIGYERRTNAVLSQVDAKEGFVRRCIDLTDLPAVPPYWARMRSRNQEGAAPLGIVDPAPALQVDDLLDLADERSEAVILDTRQPEAFAAGHIPGSLNVGLGASFPTWAGTVVPEGARVLLVVEDADEVLEATWHLLRIGYDRPLGWLAGGIRAYRITGRDIASMATTTVSELADRADEVHVLDVRQPSEWSEFHAPNAQFITGAELPERIDEVPRDREVVVACGSGYRSSVASSLLQREGHPNVTNLLGGMRAWQVAGLPTSDG